ncbi:MAG: hypothetical protein HC927_05755, partial [Deltaproteobacteria bacterium]|nr:hypothetical protein [Deltaproteobacteria bacterium]
MSTEIVSGTRLPDLAALEHAHLVAGYRVWQPVPWPLRVVGFVYRLLARIVFDYPLEPRPGWHGWTGERTRLFARL